ncbi:MAG TPA: prolipoprotein diacylglyceryl transferase [Steroidobacteraceae bacterium]|jgi:phosphatidylglycerol:prolipoprotein diacylglycerol transferase|nr:prolipoprotein diacylglyceryl transferase [Steroidobacteraceae bacterium]
MLTYPGFDPIAFQVGRVKVHWYGIMYLLGFAAAWWLARVRAAKPGSTWKAVDVDDLIFYCMLGVILGGRIGYILFYGLKFWAADPWYPLKIWEGGMSFHGGLLGVVAAMTLFGWRRGRSAADVYDFTAPLPALGLFFGRIGNFINSELWGKVTTVPWGFRVDGQVRHPSQLYEASLEGLLLFAVMWGFTSRPRPRLAPSGLFLAFYGVARFLVEFVRVPDEHIGYLAGGWLTEGQLLSLPMILAGIALMAWAYRSRVPSGNFAIAH